MKGKKATPVYTGIWHYATHTNKYEYVVVKTYKFEISSEAIKIFQWLDNLKQLNVLLRNPIR